MDFYDFHLKNMASLLWYSKLLRNACARLVWCNDFVKNSYYLIWELNIISLIMFVKRSSWLVTDYKENIGNKSWLKKGLITWKTCIEKIVQCDNTGKRYAFASHFLPLFHEQTFLSQRIGWTSPCFNNSVEKIRQSFNTTTSQRSRD